ncbi:MAG: metal-dependent hydrolase [Pseudomonadota bacterium]
MDSITQAAFGAVVAQCIAGRELGPRAALLGAACGTLPDLDVVISYADPVAQMTYHRTWSHSLFWLSVATPVVWLLARWTVFWRKAGRMALLAIWLSFITHPVLDAFTVYGTQMLLPFSDYPVSIGSVFIIDLLVTLPLLAALIAARKGQRTLWLQGSLVIVSAYLMLTLVVQQRLETGAIKTTGGNAASIKAIPAAFNPLRWRLLWVRDGQHCDQFVAATGTATADGWQCYRQQRELLASLSAHWPVERMQWFTHGFYAINQVGGDVVLSDIRMGVEGFYIFRFVVGHEEQGSIVAVQARQLPPRRPGWNDMQRAWGL